jgi:hypothetical protein
MLSRGRIDKRVRAMVHANTPLRDTVSSPNLANEGLTCRACSIAARIPISGISLIRLRYVQDSKRPFSAFDAAKRSYVRKVKVNSA